MSRLFHFLCGFVLGVPILALPSGVRAQTQTASVTRTLRGTVRDSLHDRPIARALVKINQRAVLTDALGRFEFAGYNDTQAFVSVTKPGFSSQVDGSDGPSSLRVTDLDSPILVQLVPDAILNGIITDRAGQPLPRVSVSVLRARYDQSGTTAVQSLNATTDSHGIYRISVPPGAIRLQTRFIPSLDVTGDALLPVAYPEQAGGRAGLYARLRPGQQERIDLHPLTGPAYPIQIKPLGLQAERTDTDRPGLQHMLRATASGRNGIPFQLFARPGGVPGVYRLDLPAGAYKLTFSSDDRENPATGAVLITMPAGGLKSPAPIELTMAPTASVPVELALDPDLPNGLPLQAPALTSFNLNLQSVDGVESAAIRLSAAADKSFRFLAPPGRYRLSTSSGGAWTVVAASYGVWNLLTTEVVLGEGAGSSPIRIVASNLTGHIDGAVKLPSGLAFARIYLIANEPALVPYYLDRTGPAGNFARNLPPGRYTVVAVPQTVEADLRDPGVAGRLAAEGKVIEITNGGKATVNLDLGAGLEDKP